MLFEEHIPFHDVVDDVLSPAEVATYLARADGMDTEPAPITVGPGKFVVRTDIRNNARLIFDDVDVAAALWAKVEPHVPGFFQGWQAVGLNERFRLYRYGPGQRFAPHFDGAFHRSAYEQSFVTVLLYLDDDMQGGHTALLDFDVVVRPKAGRLFVFEHAVLHEGAEVTAGVKHVLRTDVMYRDPAHDDES
mgnify:CR=1 FL=1